MSFDLLRTNANQYHVTVIGMGSCESIARSLVRHSVEFHVEPLPDNFWQFTVKPEARRQLDQAIEYYDIYRRNAKILAARPK